MFSAMGKKLERVIVPGKPFGAAKEAFAVTSTQGARSRSARPGLSSRTR